MSLTQTATRLGPVSAGDPRRVLIHLVGWFTALEEQRPDARASAAWMQAIVVSDDRDAWSSHWSALAARFANGTEAA